MIILDTNVLSEPLRPVHGAAVATRNTFDFEGLGVELIDPWAR